MRQVCLFRLVFGVIVRVLACGAVACGAVACEDDILDEYRGGGPLVFKVETPGSWTNGTGRAVTKSTSIKRMSQSAEAKPLYLVTEISEDTVSAVSSETLTRGKPVHESKDLPEHFGLSAICYTGTLEGNEDEWTTNFAHDMKVSVATGKPVDGKLDWMGSGKVKFFAYSPYSGEESVKGIISHSSAGEKGVPTLTYTVPGDVTKQPDLMVATADCTGDGSGTEQGKVSLHFKHALTAITIKTGKEMLAGKITGVKITGVYGTGKYEIGADSWTVSGDPRDLEVEQEVGLPKDKDESEDDKDEYDKNIYTKPGISINSGEYTFMMIPQELGEDAELIVYFTDNLTQTPRTLTAELKGMKWEKGKLVTYSISSSGIVVESVVDMTIHRDGVLPYGGYKLKEGKMGSVAAMTRDYVIAEDNWMTFEEQEKYLPVSGYLCDVDLTASVRVTQVDEETKLLSPSVEVEYSIDGSAWSKEGGYGWKPKGEKVDLDKTVKGSLVLPAQPVFKTIQGRFAESSEKGLENDPYDLVENNPLAKESANCYIVNSAGFYKFPLYYGNTYNGQVGNKAYTYLGNNKGDMVLEKFPGHDDKPIPAGGAIPDVNDAIVVWQDSPDLVTDVKVDKGYVCFRVPAETLNEGNAVIAVHNQEGTILWSWHIWVTYHDWYNSTLPTATSTGGDDEGTLYAFAPCNLGYCEPHGGDDERDVLVRFRVTLPDGTSWVLKDGEVKLNGKTVKGGVISLQQHSIEESLAGDNAYYQWGRKDAMLPGVYSKDRKAAGGDPRDFNMNNKKFYSTKEYCINGVECGQSIGYTIQHPHHFLLSKRPIGTDDVQNYKRRHWHDGRQAAYGLRTIMNFWDSQLDEPGKSVSAEGSNGKSVTKTIYDPSPAGYQIPPPNAFTGLAPKVGKNVEADFQEGKFIREMNEDRIVGWTIVSNTGSKFYFPATGLRDMGRISSFMSLSPTWAAHANVTFVASSGFYAPQNTTSSSCLLFYIDNREGRNEDSDSPGPLSFGVHVNAGTNNAYGFTIRPVRDRLRDIKR